MRPGSVSKDPAVDHLPHGKSGADIQEEALKLHAYRLQLIASNIANADTPNYKAVDIDFREALRVSQMTGASSAMHTDQTLHSQGSSSAIPQLLSYKYSVPVQGSVDGNTVELDAERAKFAESAVRYEFSLNRIGGHYKMMMELLTTLKD
ncbi:flagellar basal body rod protein FlgB [Herbaspirillum sp. HC18]|nr:flagellar basal body rod protein FlgB [Herbaspirillum sp. HC18]